MSVESVLGELFTATDPAQRAAGFLRTICAALQANAAALCRTSARPGRDDAWYRTAVFGEAAGLPSHAQVAAVVAGELEPFLPARRAVLVASDQLALAIDGVDPEDDAVDEIAGLLCTYAAIADADGTGDGLDEVRSIG